MKINDRVKYSRNWLRSVGAYTGTIPFLKGTITQIDTFGSGLKLAKINWDNDPEKEFPQRVNVKNLTIVGHSEAE